MSGGAPHLRFWLGRRRLALPPAEFAQTLTGSFIPATAALMAPHGLLCYAPVILPFEKPPSLADETALLVYHDDAAYKASKSTLVGKIYGAAHHAPFDMDNSASTARDTWAIDLSNAGLQTLGSADWPGDLDASTLGPQNFGFAALTLSLALTPTLQSHLAGQMQAQLHRFAKPLQPIRLWAQWQASQGGRAYTACHLYLWCICPTRKGLAAEAIKTLLSDLLAGQGQPLSIPVSAWQAPDFEPGDPNSAVSTQAWGRAWVYTKPPALPPEAPKAS